MPTLKHELSPEPANVLDSTPGAEPISSTPGIEERLTVPTPDNTEDNLDLNRYWPIEPDDVPSLSPILEYVVPYILTARDAGSGVLETLPIAGTPEWQSSSDRVKWAALAVLALEGVKAAERGPLERIAYSEGIARVAAEMNWAGYGYETGYEKGRRDQKHIEGRIRRGIERRTA